MHAIRRCPDLYGPLHRSSGLFSCVLQACSRLCLHYQQHQQSCNYCCPRHIQALFCFGWNDAQQYWLCKNSFGPDWGLPGGVLKIAYGAAFTMQSKYTFGVEFAVDNRGRRALQNLRTNTSPDPEQPRCYLHKPPQPTRLIQLAADISAAWAELKQNWCWDLTAQQPTLRQILEQWRPTMPRGSS